jgi:hypothetical protein
VHVTAKPARQQPYKEHMGYHEISTISIFFNPELACTVVKHATMTGKKLLEKS